MAIVEKLDALSTRVGQMLAQLQGIATDIDTLRAEIKAIKGEPTPV